MWSLSGRLQLIWDSPIVAGTVLAMLAPWLYLGCLAWTRQRWLPRSVFVTSVVVELGLLVGLVFTQSRGPMLAWAAAMVGMGTLGWKLAARPRRMLIVRIAVMLLFVAALSVTTDAGDRWVAGAMIADKSVTNRLDIWSVCLTILWIKPWTGLSGGESGWFYSQWFQPEGSRYLYTGVLNGFLETGVEHGLLALAGLVFAAGIVVSYPWLVWRSARLERAPPLVRWIGICSSGALMVYFGANLTSSLLEDRSLSGIAAASAVGFMAFVVCTADRSSVLKTGGFTALVAIATTLALRSWPAWREREFEVAIEGGAVVIARSGATHDSSGQDDDAVSSPVTTGRDRTHPSATKTEHLRTAAVLVDRDVLGPLFGQELRRLLATSNQFDAFVVFDPRRPLPIRELERFGRIVLSGRTVRFACFLAPDETRELVLVHPQGDPECVRGHGSVRVRLPGGDELGQNSRWIEAGRKAGFDVIVAGTGGQSVVGEQLGEELEW